MTTDVMHDARGGLGDDDLALLTAPLAGLAADPRTPVEVIGGVRLCSGVHHLVLEGATTPTVVVKRLRSRKAQLERQITHRWLPGVGLADMGPPRLATVAEPDGRYVWHVYADLGPWGLDRPGVDQDTIALAMRGLAAVHAGFAQSAMLPEPRFAAGDLGVYFYTRSVRDALGCVDRLRTPALDLTPEQINTREGLLARLQRLVDDEPARVALLQQAGPETLVHGDLTRSNIFVLPHQAVRLIDWDHAGIGPAAFDISTHVAYYDADERGDVLGAYLDAMAELGQPYAEGIDWGLLVATFEAGRLANQIIWLAIGTLQGNDWGFASLADWGQALAAVVDQPAAVNPRSAGR